MIHLFSQFEFANLIDERKNQIHGDIERLSEPQVLSCNEEEFCKAIEENYKIELPILLKEQISQTRSDCQFDVSKDQFRHISDRSQPVYIKGTSINLHLPFKGDGALFRFRPSCRGWGSNPPSAQIENDELIFNFVSEKPDPVKIKADLDRHSSHIEEYLKDLTSEADVFNSEIKPLAQKWLRLRKEKIARDASVVEALGFPLKRRSDAPQTYKVPSIRRKISYQTPSTTGKASAPEPELDTSEYEYILTIIQNMALVMEKSPHAFNSMEEEVLRFHFLVQLNAQYEGQASGETFNYSGKTDILISYKGKNIFIAECKFWHGQKHFLESIDQILGYTSWRDTKTAIILFNKQKDLSKILEMIPSITKTHKNFIREQNIDGETAFRFIFSQPNDPERHILLTVLVFDIPKG